MYSRFQPKDPSTKSAVGSSLPINTQGAWGFRNGHTNGRANKDDHGDDAAKRKAWKGASIRACINTIRKSSLAITSRRRRLYALFSMVAVAIIAIGRSTRLFHIRTPQERAKAAALARRRKYFLAVNDDIQYHVPATAASLSSSRIAKPGKCAICFFGLPRSFKSMVLPSIRKNILIPNQNYRCDVYVQFYDLDKEQGGTRSGAGGTINTSDIFLLETAIRDFDKTNVRSSKKNTEDDDIVVSFVNNTNAEFWEQRGELVKKYETTMDENGKYMYFPWEEQSFEFPITMHNMLKQWHSIDSAWNHMEKVSQQFGRKYDRVAMLRNDVLFVTPIDIYETEQGIWDHKNKFAVVPIFAGYPVNDRLMYGPYDAVKVWSTQRFPRVEEHVETFPQPGYKMHPERFLNHTILTSIQYDLRVPVRTNPDICFLRARADESVWISDCNSTDNGSTRGFEGKNVKKLVEQVLGNGRRCVRTELRPRIIHAHCPVAGLASINATVTLRDRVEDLFWS